MTDNADIRFEITRITKTKLIRELRKEIRELE
jgi:hypothetical protein